MTVKKRIWIPIAAVALLLIALVVGICVVQYNRTYVVVGGSEFRRDTEVVDLTGQELDHLDRLKELKGLRRLDLRETGLTREQYQDLQAALPECEIIWSVPFQEGFCSSNLTTLTVDRLSQADFEAFAMLPNLKYIKADTCTDYEVLRKLMEQYPQYRVSYTVTFSGKQVYNNTQVIYIQNPDPEEVRQGLPWLPDVTTVNFKGKLPEVEELIALQQEFPEILFYWEFLLFEVPVNTTMDFIDLSGVQLEGTKELERYIPCFYNLTQVDMVNCGISNEEMDALNGRYEQIKFVWGVKIWGTTLRTDAKYFMPAKLHLSNTGSLRDMKYCREMVVLDFGHYRLKDISFLEHMPDLQYLLLCESPISDLSIIGNCTGLVTLELFKCPLTDLAPLTNLTKLRNLNLCKTPTYPDPDDEVDGERRADFGDITPLLQMTWLDRLWLTLTYMSDQNRQTLRDTLSHTEIVFYHKNSSVGNGWRHSYDYYYHRDVMGMYYMT